jgi:hypothetical protein
MIKLPKLFFSSQTERDAAEEHRLLRQEAVIGGQLFGKLPAGHHREFFCLDEHTWIWHEAWTDNKGQSQSITTRYDVKPNGIVKSRNGLSPQKLSLDEARNLYQAVDLYGQRVGAHYTKLLQNA